MNLRFKLNTASFAGEKRHAQVVMRELGITYRRGVPQPIADQWWFIDCANVPTVLPSFIEEMSPHAEEWC